MGIFRFWRVALGSVAAIYPVVIHMLDVAGYVDLVIAHREQPGWVGDMIHYVLDPPNYLTIPLLIAGLLLIWWDAHRKTKTVRLTNVTPWSAASTPVEAIQKPRSESTSKTMNLNAYSQKVFFDYSTYSGHIAVNKSSVMFDLYFSKASDTRIHLLAKRYNVLKIARIKSPALGQKIEFDKLDSTSDYYPIFIGDNFIVQNSAGKFLLGKVLSLKDDSLGDANDEVCFAYEFDSSGIGQFTAL